jgi:hypothetical protein
MVGPIRSAFRKVLLLHRDNRVTSVRFIVGRILVDRKMSSTAENLADRSSMNNLKKASLSGFIFHQSQK